MLTKCIVGVMVSMLEFGRLSQTKDYKLQKTGWLKIQIRCQSETKYLPMDCCSSELALQKSNQACWSNIKWTSLSPHRM